MADQIIGVTIKGIGDFSDVVSNVNSVQKALTKLKLPDKLGSNLNKNISSFMSEWERYQQKIANGIKNQGDFNSVNKSLNTMLNSYEKIIGDFSKLSAKDFKDIFKLDEGAFARIQSQIKNIQVELDKLKLDPNKIMGSLGNLSQLTKSKGLTESGGSIDRLKAGFEKGGFEGLKEAKTAFSEIEAYYARIQSRLSQPTKTGWEEALKVVRTEINTADQSAGVLVADMKNLEQILNGVGAKGKSEIDGMANALNRGKQGAEEVVASLRRVHQDEFNFNRQVEQVNRQVQSYFGLSQMIRKVGNIAKSAFNTVKELDKAMTETAVVTNFNVGDMWEMLPTYTEQANQLGSTIKDVYEAATLYYQQGLNTNQAMGLANETLKMARIAGMDAAEATDMMTAALRGFNMEVNQASAQKINDVYSKLAAITASNTQEIGTAMEKTASLANSANMDFETTSAFLAQMIETTREAPENLGTAMKTIIARFQEMKKDPTKLVDSEGVAMDVNKIDTALKSIGVALTNTKGEFRDLDDVFLEISSKWDSLSQGQQRYIATTAAGSRQQSRFIAMMSNYDRTMELVEEANNSAGASQKQFEKTMDSMSAKLNQLKNAWNQFTMGLMNNQILKGGVDVLTTFFSTINKIIDALSKISPKPLEGLTKSFLTFGATLTGLNFAKNLANGMIGAGVSWWTGAAPVGQSFKEGFLGSRMNASNVQTPEANQSTAQSVSVPVTVEGYLESVKASNIPEEAKAEIEALVKNTKSVAEIPVEVDGVLAGVRTKSDDPKVMEDSEKLILGQDGRAEAKKFEGLKNNVNGVTQSLTTMGMALRSAGATIGGPFGAALAGVGSIMSTLGATIGSVTAAFTRNLEAAVANAAGLTIQEAAQQGVTLSSLKGTVAMQAFSKALWSTLGPYVAVAAAAIALYFAFKKLDEMVVTDKEKLEEASEAAERASEAYSSAKQEMSELTDALDQIQTNEDAFDGLVAGTAEFNEKLVEANQKITELIAKYPELNKYLTTDENGLMHLSQEGIDFIKERQQQIVGRASAMNVLQSNQLKAEEYRQEAKKIRKDSIAEVAEERGSSGGYYQPLYEAKKIDEQKAKLLEQQAKTTEDIGKQQAIINSLSGLEIKDREKVAAIYEGSYDTMLKQVKTEKDISKMRKAYADFYGYEYNDSTKKITDSNGDEIKNATDSVIRDAMPEITVLANIEANGESLDSMMDTIDKKFVEGFGSTLSESGNLLTDILSNNIETDAVALQQIAQDPGRLQEAVNNLSEKEVAALLNISEEEVNNHLGKYQKQLAKNVTERASNVLNAQKQTYEELGAMMAQAQYGDVNFKMGGWQSTVADSISKQIQQLTTEQQNILNTVGKTLKENVGVEAMSTFLDNGFKIYKQNNDKTVKEFNNIIEGINWDSATSRLEGYNKMMHSTRDEIRQTGEEMRTSSDEVNLLGESFDEFLGGDWLELSEKADDFKNATGEIDSSGISKMAEQSRQLKAMLDSGEASASGLAMALQGVEDGSILQVNDSVLKLLSSLNKLKDTAEKAHETIKNFDPGIDYGEGEDFVKENAKKVQEYIDAGEYGNEQVENYIKLAAGESKWNAALKASNGNVEEAVNSLKKYVTFFKDGFNPIWQQMVAGKDINGKKLSDNITKAFDEKRINDDLKRKFKDVDFDEVIDSETGDGYLDIQIGELTTDELTTYFQEIYGVSKEYAELLMQDLANYNATLGAKLESNDLQKAIETPEFQESRKDQNENVVLTDEDIRIIESAPNGEEDLPKIAKELGYETVEQMKKYSLHLTNPEGEARNAYTGTLMDDYTKKYFETGGEGLQGFIKREEAFFENGKLNLKELMADTNAKNFTEEQTMQGAFKAYEEAKAQGKSTTYEGVELGDDIKSLEEFGERINEITETDKWVTVGETIGQQIVSAMESSAFITKATSGELDPAFNKTGQTSDDFGKLVETLKVSGESKEEQKQNVTDYLSHSKEMFEKMDPAQQAKALEGITAELNKLNFKPEEIASAIENGLGVVFSSGRGGQGPLTGAEGQVNLDTDRTRAILEAQLQDPFPLNFEVDPAEMQKQLSNITADIKGKFGGFTSSSFVPSRAKGQNNPNSAFYRVGTMARGSGGGYTISGRPTLLGEEDEELVWEPKQNRAFMVGSNGPQFANISKSAVVWNADQTKRIKKNSGNISSFGTGAKGINNFGTMAEGTKVPGIYLAEVTGIFKGFDKKDPVPIPVIPDFKKSTSKKGESAFKVPFEATSLSLGENAKKPIGGLVGHVETLINKAGRLKDKIFGTATVDKVIKGKSVSGEPVTVKAKAAVNAKVNTDEAQGKITKMASEASKGQTMTVDAKTRSAESKIKQLVSYFKKRYELKYGVSGPDDVKVPVKLIYDGSWSRTITFKKAARGMNNYIPYQSLPSIGSAVSGRYGRLGPNGKGGPTLTGEKGYEVAWIPSESRSMILGANGPQMIDLPSDTVVWTHEQSKKIMSQKAIPAGSHRKPSTTNTRKLSEGNKDNGGNDGKNPTKGGGDGKKQKKSSKRTNSGNDKEVKKIIKKAGKVTVWWDNQTRKIESIQRRVDKALKAFEKEIKKVGTTFKSIETKTGTYINNLNKSIDLNKQSRTKADNTLKTLTKRNKRTDKQKEADAEVKRARKRVKNAKGTKDKDDDKRAKKALKAAKKKQQKAYGSRFSTISYDATEKVTKNGKTKKEKKSKKQKIDLSRFINYDSDTGAYVINQKEIDRVAKKNKSKAKAIKEAANKAIDTPQDRYNTAQDNIDKAKEELEELGQKLYETFHGWEVELTKIWNLTQKISNIEAKTNRLKEAISLQEAQMASGYLKASSAFNKQTLTLFSSQLKSMNESISNRTKLIGEQQKSLKDLFTGASTQKTLSTVNSKLNKNEAAKKKEDTVKSRKAAVKKQNKVVDKYTKKIEKEKAKKAAANDKIKKIKENRKLSKEEKNKQVEEQKAIIRKANANINNYRVKRQDAKENLALKKQSLTKARKAYKAVSGNRLSESDEARLTAEQAALKDDEKIRNMALKYMDYSANGDGTFNVEFDTEAFEADKEKLGITSDDANKIQEYVKDIQSLNEELNNSYTEQTQALAELYTTLADLQAEQADNSDELLEIVEGEQQKELEKIRGLSESLNEAIRDLLDEVKEKLTERRNREDNLKTEQDISKKQQRLASLRADTSGGHAVEIAQLEKEIADAQQSYGRTLEDQLLDRMQKQADEAAKQRERMIELQEAVLEGNGEQSNLAQVNEWMSLIKQSSMEGKTSAEMESVWEEIKAQWLSNKDFDSQTNERQGELLKDWEKFRTSLETNYQKQELTKQAIVDTQENLKTLETSINSLVKVFENPPKLIDGKQLYDEWKKAQDAEEKAEAEKKKAEEAKQKQKEKDKQANEKAKKAQAKEKERLDATGDYVKKLEAASKNGSIGEKGLTAVANLAKKAGLGAGDYLAHLAATDGLDWKEVLTAAKAAGYSKDRLAATFDSEPFKKAFDAVYGKGEYKKARKKKAEPYKKTGLVKVKNGLVTTQGTMVTGKFATGGLNTQTGPAWLDGTPTKPELVLNATDTKNFLALKDVLGDVMGAINSTDNSYRSNDVYNINVNVDKIANDYDVDKMVDRVKKEITKSAGYRNVTQARAFR